MEMVAEGPAVDDTVIVPEDVASLAVAIDAVSLDLLKGSELDYARDLGGARFVVRNPQADARCGCGNSFAIGA
jgi:iron-sulfur cluster insertion protein